MVVLATRHSMLNRFDVLIILQITFKRNGSIHPAPNPKWRPRLIPHSQCGSFFEWNTPAINAALASKTGARSARNAALPNCASFFLNRLCR